MQPLTPWSHRGIHHLFHMDTSIWTHTLTNIAFLSLAFVQCLHLFFHLDFWFPLIPAHLLFFYSIESTVFITYFEPYQKHFHSALPAGLPFHPYSPHLWCPRPLGAIHLLSTSVAMQWLDAFPYERSVCWWDLFIRNTPSASIFPCDIAQKGPKVSSRARWLKIFLLDSIQSEWTILSMLKIFALFYQDFSLEENPKEKFGQCLMTSLPYFQKVLCLMFRHDYFVLTFRKYDASKPWC